VSPQVHIEIVRGIECWYQCLLFLVLVEPPLGA